MSFEIEDLSFYFSCLTFTQRVIIKMHYGIGTERGVYTYKKIGDILGKTNWSNKISIEDLLTK